MADNSHIEQAKRAIRMPGARRRRMLALAMLTACLVAASFAVVLNGSARTALGAAAFVFLITAAHCAGSMGLGPRKPPPVDIEAPPPVTPLPQSPVTEIYDPVRPADNQFALVKEDKPQCKPS